MFFLDFWPEILFVILSLLDWHTTNQGIKLGLTERNPLIVKLLGESPDSSGLLAFKAVVVALIIYPIVVSGIPYVIHFINAGYIALVARNAKIVKEAKNA